MCTNFINTEVSGILHKLCVIVALAISTGQVELVILLQGSIRSHWDKDGSLQLVSVHCILPCGAKEKECLRAMGSFEFSYHYVYFFLKVLINRYICMDDYIYEINMYIHMYLYVYMHAYIEIDTFLSDCLIWH